MGKYSKKEISKAGEILISSKSEEERNQAYNKISDWRANHLQPLIVMRRGLTKLLKKNKIAPILISQRLKRLTSIMYKLDLNPKMGLGGMQDIGGYRAVLKDVKDLKRLEKIFENYKIKHKLEKINNYVEKPKTSGYRSIHYIYRYFSKSEKYNDLRVELQIRTKLQHNWATAVETAGVIKRTSLKSSQGDDEWLNFFKIVSSLFAIKEGLPILDEHKNLKKEELMIQYYKLSRKLKIIDTLQALRVTTKHFEKKSFPDGYYLLNIDIENQKVQIRIFRKNQYVEATDNYLQIEKEIEKNVEDTKNAVVLVLADSLKSLKKAYPSYFLDTSEFLSELDKINEECEAKKLVS